MPGLLPGGTPPSPLPLPADTTGCNGYKSIPAFAGRRESPSPPEQKPVLPANGSFPETPLDSVQYQPRQASASPDRRRSPELKPFRSPPAGSPVPSLLLPVLPPLVHSL